MCLKTTETNTRNSTKLYQPENQNQLGFAWWCIWWRDKLLFLLIHSCKWQPIRSIHYLWTLVSFIASFYVLIVTISFSGKCFGNRGQIHETHKVLFQSISVLVSRNPFGHTCPHPCLIILGRRLWEMHSLLSVQKYFTIYAGFL